MPETEDNKNNTELQTKFWLLLTLSALLIITFIYYLPLRFRHIATSEENNHHDEKMEAGHTPSQPVNQAELKKLPLYAPDGQTKPLVFELKNEIKEFVLELNEIRWEYGKGKWVHAWSYNNRIPGPEIRVAEGDKVRFIVKNNLPAATSIHWHGIHLENKADGVPGLTQYAIKPGETYTYEFTAKNAGTHFYHTHGSSHLDAALQFDMGLTGAFIIEPKSKTKYDREYVYMLDEWEINSDGTNGALANVSESGEHLHKHDYNVFTINGRIFPDTEPLIVKEGEKILIRLINAGTQEIHPMHTHGHSFKVVAIDGNPVPKIAQQTRDTLTVMPGERYDIELTANNPGVWLFHCHHVHHASAGMVLPFLYEGYKPCCLE